MKLPRITPLRLVRQPKPFDHPDWVSELKHDGFRGVAYISKGQCQLVSRNNHVYKRFDPLAETLAKLKVADVIVDREIICVDAKGNSVFNELFFRRPVFLCLRFAVAERSRLAAITVA